MRNSRGMLPVLFAAYLLTGCGGPGGSAGGGTAGQVSTTASSDPNWEAFKIDGASTFFEMPKPVKMQEDAESGMVLYVGQKPEQKLSFRVGIARRKVEDEQGKGFTDDQVLSNWATNVLAATKKQFESMGFQAQFIHDGNFKVDTGVGQQYHATVGKATVLVRFYVNNLGLYYVEATTQDDNNPDFQRFINSFKP